MACPTAPTRGRALSDAPDRSERIRVHARAGCARCRARVEADAGLRTVAREELPVVPPDVSARAARIASHGRARAAATTSAAPIYQTASRVRDSFADANAAGARFVRSDVRHVLYEANGYEVALRLSPASSGAEGVVVAGQILPPVGAAVGAAAGANATLFGDGAPRETPLNALGEFAFPDVARGAYDLIVDTGVERVLVEQVDVRADGLSSPPERSIDAPKGGRS